MKTPFGNIAYAERGSGEAALFLHGFPLNGYQWRGALQRLSPYRRCIAPDFLGLGNTEVAPGQSVAPDAQVAMLADLLDRLGIDRVDLVANDSGGQAAQLFLARYPQRVRTLLLTNCDSEIECPPPALLPVLELAKQGKFVEQWLAPWLADKTLARSARGPGRADLHLSVPSQRRGHRYLPGPAGAQRRPHPRLRDRARTATGCRASARRWRASTAPTRIVWGTGDTIFSEQRRRASGSQLRQLARRASHRRREAVLPGGVSGVIAEEARALWGVQAASRGDLVDGARGAVHFLRRVDQARRQTRSS